MLNASIAGRYDDVGINRVDRGAQSFERIGGPGGKRTLDGMRDEKCMALGWTNRRNRAGLFRASPMAMKGNWISHRFVSASKTFGEELTAPASDYVNQKEASVMPSDATVSVLRKSWLDNSKYSPF